MLYFVVTKGGKMKHFFQALFIILNKSQYRLNLEKMVLLLMLFYFQSRNSFYKTLSTSQAARKSFSRQFCVKGYMYSGISWDSAVLVQSVCLFRGNKTTGGRRSMWLGRLIFWRFLIKLLCCRQQRRSNLYSALSQPDLLNMTNDMMMEREMDHEEDELTRLPNTSKLRSALSVQNLLDVDDKVSDRQLPKPSHRP